MQPPPLTGPEAIEAVLKAINLDQLEKEQQDIIRAKKKTARPRAVRLLNIIQGMRKNEMQPADLMLRSVPVIPPGFRPFSVTGDTFLPGDANEMYRDLMEYRRLYTEQEKAFGAQAAMPVYADMAKAVRATYGYGESPNPKIRARQVKGFFDVVTGTNPKTSFYMSKMLSKPVDTVGRGVIVPDADLDMDEVGVPEDMAWKLYANYVQRRMVTGGFSPAGALQHVKDRSTQARKALDDELAARPVVITRSPAWHKFNVTGQRPRIVDGDAIRINTFITEGHNADFNGDSVSGSTSVIYRLDGEVFQSSFVEFAERLTGLPVDDMVAEADSYTRIYSLAKDKVEVLTIDDDMRPVWSPADELTVHTSHGSCYDVFTHTGKRVTATEHHNFARLSDDLQLETLKTEDMGVTGTFIPAVYNYAPTDAAPIVLRIGGFTVPLTTDFAWLLGFFAAEGSVTAKDVSFCATERDYFQKAARIMWEVFGTDNKPQGTEKHKDCILREYRGEITRWFLRVCGKGFAGKMVPHFMFQAPRDLVMAYFAGVLDGDGSVTDPGIVDAAMAAGSFPNVDVRVSMKNRGFLEALSGLLASVGIRTFIKQDAKSTTLSVITPDFHKLVEADDSSRKIGHVRHIIEAGRPPYKSSHDIIPVTPSVMKLLRAAAATLAHPDAECRRRRAVWQAGRAGKKVSRFDDAFKRQQAYLTRGKARDYVFTYGSELQDSALFARWMAIIENEAVQWERVDDVARTEREDVTFDVSVPRGRELFTVAGNLLVHNTMSLHVPSSPEAVKDVNERLMASRMLWSTKNRNQVMGAPKHEQIVGLSLGQAPGGQKRRFTSEQEAMHAIESGQIDLNDDIEIEGAKK